jgi:hypothetical protein
MTRAAPADENVEPSYLKAAVGPIAASLLGYLTRPAPLAMANARVETERTVGDCRKRTEG